jgi:hypothetical protein
MAILVDVDIIDRWLIGSAAIDRSASCAERRYVL